LLLTNTFGIMFTSMDCYISCAFAFLLISYCRHDDNVIGYSVAFISLTQVALFLLGASEECWLAHTHTHKQTHT